jgi:hypothetical protein
VPRVTARFDEPVPVPGSENTSRTDTKLITHATSPRVFINGDFFLVGWNDLLNP